MSELVGRTMELLAETKGGFTSAVKNIFNTRTMATLKIRDLSVGDWVMVEWPDGERWCGRLIRLSETGAVEVRCTNDKYVRCSSNFITSIPITAEIFEKNGFEPDSSCWRIYRDGGGHIEIWEDEGEWYLSVDSAKYLLWNLHWVHQIQHLMRVWGVDKEINL